jgi:hypothetical protein
MVNINNIPNEIWFNILQHTDLKTLSSLLCVNNTFKNMIEPVKWDIIDSMHDRGCFVPKNLNTYLQYIYCIDWTTYVYNKINIPDDVIIQLHDYIDFAVITTKQKFSETLIRKFFHKIPITNLLMFQNVPIDILTPLIESNIPQFFPREYWYYVWKNQKITKDFINKFKQYVDWHAVSTNKDALSFDIINEFHNELIWPEVTSHGIHESIIEHFLYKMDAFSWKNVAYFSQLSETFILKYIDNLDILALFTSQQMSESLILYLLEKVNNIEDIHDIWGKIALHQQLSMEFISNNKDKLNLVFMIRNPRIKRKFLKLLYN